MFQSDVASHTFRDLGLGNSLDELEGCLVEGHSSLDERDIKIVHKPVFAQDGWSVSVTV